MNKNTIKYHRIVSKIAIVMLLLAIPTFWFYGYYILLRWVVCVGALFSVWMAHRLGQTKWVFLMAFLALLFNPFIPVFLPKVAWIIVDIITAILFFRLISNVKGNHKNSRCV